MGLKKNVNDDDVVVFVWMCAKVHYICDATVGDLIPLTDSTAMLAKDSYVAFCIITLDLDLDMLENDFLYNNKLIFKYRENGNYNDIIMLTLNKLMTVVDTSAEY